MANGWTPERRAKQSLLIHKWNPSAKSTGPKTAAGKSRSCQNAYKYGGRSRQQNELLRRLKKMLKGHSIQLKELVSK